MQDIDKLKDAIEDGLTVYTAIKEDLTDGKLSIVEGASLVLSHGGKAIRLISSLKEIADEVKDLDGDEMEQLTELIAAKFGGSDASVSAIEKIAIGAGYLNQGIQELIAAKKQILSLVDI